MAKLSAVAVALARTPAALYERCMPNTDERQRLRPSAAVRAGYGPAARWPAWRATLGLGARHAAQRSSLKGPAQATAVAAAGDLEPSASVQLGDGADEAERGRSFAAHRAGGREALAGLTACRSWG